MSKTQLILNGGFDNGSANWSGTDIEAYNFERSYFATGSTTNRVAEMDGGSNQITVMRQSFDVAEPGTAELSFRAALRSLQPANVGDGFRVEVLGPGGSRIFSQNILPQQNGWETYSFDIDFTAAGRYTLRLTELGDNDSRGAVVDDISLLICFVAGTLIRTDRGRVPVETLQVGDRIWTRDGGFVPLRWISRRRVTLAEQLADQSLCPVTFAPGSLGEGLPRRALSVSPQHRMLISDWRSAYYFGEDETLAAAIGLVNGATVTQSPSHGDVTYVHFLLDGHQIVESEGALSESFYPSALSVGGVDRPAREELFRLFPALLSEAGPLARPALSRREARLVA